MGRKTQLFLKFLLVLLTSISALVIYLISLDHPEFHDRLAVIPETETEINNSLYDEEKYAKNWWNTDRNSPESYFYGLHAFNEIRFAFFWRHIQPLIKEKGSLRVLDVGCGGGILTERIAREMQERGIAGEVIGVDMSKNSVQVATEHAKKAGLNNIKYIVGSAYQLPVEDNSFDIVVSTDVLEHLHDLQQAVKEIKRVLKPDGLFVFDTVNRTVFSRVFVKISERILKFIPKGVHDYRLFIKPEEMKKLFDMYGFQFNPAEIRGISPKPRSISDFLKCIKKCVNQFSLEPLYTNLNENDDTQMLYMGAARLLTK
jgi:2-polyprenyl-6-hydroxyphenyl methylase/3-demethylubiquinone-9 3-methyltransferase